MGLNRVLFNVFPSVVAEVFSNLRRETFQHIQHKNMFWGNCTDRRRRERSGNCVDPGVVLLVNLSVDVVVLWKRREIHLLETKDGPLWVRTLVPGVRKRVAICCFHNQAVRFF